MSFLPYQQILKGPGGFRNGHRAAGVHGGMLLVSDYKECTTMNAFVEHHNNSIQFGYRCFDRLLLNGLIQPFQQPERVLGFFNTYRQGKRVTRRTLTEIADQFQNWLKGRSEKWGAISKTANRTESP